MPRLLHTRRELLQAAGWAGTASDLGCGRASRGTLAGGAAAPELVLHNARVFTVNESQPRAEAFAVNGSRFVAVGRNEDLRPLSGAGTKLIDAEGMTVTPGFIDAHTHPSGAGVDELLHVNVDLRSVGAIQTALYERVVSTPPGEWVVGFKYDDTKLDEGQPINRRDLDAIAPSHPVEVRHRGGHTAVYNSAAFRLAGITAQTPDPRGGKVYRQAGELPGLVAEHARAPLRRLIPSGSTRQQRQAGVKLISELMTAAGLTSVHQTGGGTQALIAYQDAYAARELLFRLYLFPSGGSGLFRGLKQAGVSTGFGDDRLRIGAVKYVADGSASERAMRMSTPFQGRPDDYGILTMSQEEIHEAVEDADRHGFQIGVHANGDVTIEMVLDAYERVQQRPRHSAPRNRIEHCLLVNPALLQRIKDLGVIPTPFCTYVHYHGNKWVNYGEGKMRSMFAHRWFLDYEIPVAGASDYTPGPYEPMMAIQSMVTRKDFQGREWGPNQRISVDEALQVCTIDGAYASFEEGQKGSIEADKLADFVVLAEDPREVEPDRIKEIEVVRTFVDGEPVHSKA